MIATSNNTTDLALDLWITQTGDTADTLLASVYVPANSGNNSNPAIGTVNVLANINGLPSDSNGNKYIVLGNTTVLSVSANTTVAAGKVLGVFASGGSF